MTLEETTLPWIRTTVCALVFALVALAAHAEDTRDYQVSLSDSEATDLATGVKLQRSDSQYCEKQRDVCLAALCGALDRDAVHEQCWEECTTQQYRRCKDEP